MGLFGWLFGEKKRGWDTDNKYLYHSNKYGTADVRDIEVWNASTKKFQKERGMIHSEKHHPNGNLKEITLRKTVSIISKNGFVEELKEKKIQVIRKFYENGDEKSESEYLFNNKSSTYKKDGLSYEYSEYKNSSDEREEIRTLYTNGKRIYVQVFENGRWVDKKQEEQDRINKIRDLEVKDMLDELSGSKKVKDVRARRKRKET